MGKTIAGYDYGAELMHVPDMKIEKILRKKKSRSGKQLGFAKFQGYPRFVTCGVVRESNFFKYNQCFSPFTAHLIDGWRSNNT